MIKEAAFLKNAGRVCAEGFKSGGTVKVKKAGSALPARKQNRRSCQQHHNCRDCCILFLDSCVHFSTLPFSRKTLLPFDKGKIASRIRAFPT